MSGKAATPCLLVEEGTDALRLTLNRPARGNSLTIELLDALLVALDQYPDARTILLTGAGRAFSTGGDIGGFLENATTPDTLQRYSEALVGRLNRVIQALIDHPAYLVAYVNGPVTGGSIGLMLAADQVLMDNQAFIQPYYAQMGFAPDGGWTAMLPAQIGEIAARRWLSSDSRWNAQRALAHGLADKLVTQDTVADALEKTLATANGLDRTVMATARRLSGTGDLAKRLDAEREAFLDHIVRPETLKRMQAFAAPAPSKVAGTV